MLRERSVEPEYFDNPARTREEIAAGYRELARVNRLFQLDDPYTRVLSRWLGRDHCRRLSILDLGAGDAWLANHMEAFAARQGWTWTVTSLDMNPVPLQINGRPLNVAGSATALPFRDAAFDLVIASQMTHHLDTDDDVLRHFREAWRVARLGLFITDMRRSALLYALLKFFLPILRLSPRMRADGLLSVRRSFTRAELQALAARSGLPGLTVRTYFGTRLIVSARKTPATAAAT